MTRERADELGLKARARVVDTCLVGVDPVLMLTGPIDATRRLLDRTGLTIADIDTFEINRPSRRSSWPGPRSSTCPWTR
jgi:acetyl-CoA C-acetyltransferase